MILAVLATLLQAERDARTRFDDDGPAGYFSDTPNPGPQTADVA